MARTGTREALAIEQSVDEMADCRVHSCPGTNGKLAGEDEPRRRRECGNLFVTHVKPLDFCLGDESHRLGRSGYRRRFRRSVYPASRGVSANLIRNSLSRLVPPVGLWHLARQSKPREAAFPP